MTNITQNVRDFLMKYPFIVKGLEKKLINIRALAFHFLSQTNCKCSLDSVMTAIRRFTDGSDSFSEDDHLKIYKDARISTKSHLVLIDIKRHFKELKTILVEVMQTVHVSQGDVLRIIDSRRSLMLVVDHSKKKEILNLIPKSELNDINESLAEMRISLPEKALTTPGIISPIISQLTLNKINIVSTVYGKVDLILLIPEVQISRCHDTLIKFLYGD